MFWVVLAALILFGAFFIAFFVMGKKKTVEVLSEKAVRKTVIASVTESGVVEPVTEVKIAADVSGEVVSLETKEGSLVKRGDVMVTIRPDNYQSALEQARASLNASIASQLNASAAREQAYVKYLQDSANFKRDNLLYQKEVIPQIEWESSKLNFDISRSQYRGAIANEKSMAFQSESRRASLKNAKSELRKTTIFASMDGTITRQNIKLGERVVGTAQMQGTELFRIADLSVMQVLVEINENDIVHLRIGDSAHIEVDAYAEITFQGTVTEIAYSASMAELSGDQITSFEVKVEIDPKSYQNNSSLMRGLSANQSPFRPGMSALVEIYTERIDNQIAIPIQAVTVRKPKDTQGKVDEDAEPEEVVFLLDKFNKVRRSTVQTGISDDKYIVILAGVSDGDRVITGPYKLLSKDLEAGMQVNVAGEVAPGYLKNKGEAAAEDQ